MFLRVQDGVEMKRLNLILDLQLAEHLRWLAEHNRCSQAAVIRRLLLQSMERQSSDTAGRAMPLSLEA